MKICLENPDDIDLNLHGLIEASAGTGKTYTIEKLVTRLILEKGCDLSRILLVTFTEKATSELKERIRKELESKLVSLPSEEKIRVQKMLQHFDEASIFTIHGFCQYLASTFSFENGIELNTKVVNQEEIIEFCYEKLIDQILHREFFSDELALLLNLVSYRRGKYEFEGKIKLCAKSIHKKDKLNPDREETGILFLKQKIQNFIAASQNLQEIFCEYGEIFLQNAYHERIHGTDRDRFREEVNEVFQRRLITLPELLFYLTSLDVKRLAKFLQPRFTGGFTYKDIFPECPDFRPIVQSIHEALKWLKAAFLLYCTLRLQELVKSELKERGELTFDTMITRIHEALCSLDVKETGKDLRETVKARWRYAIIDEFQDTDLHQWEIFQTLFLDDSHSLFLVGDPKQAIYRFRGADIYVYLQAKEKIFELATEKKARIYSLSTNYRSLKNLVLGFNRLFSCPEWFETDSMTTISYEPSKASEVKKMTWDNEQEAPVHFFMGNLTDVNAYEYSYANFIVSEIQNLLKNPVKVVTQDQSRPLGLDDICILAKSQAQEKFLERFLKKHKIPASVYRKKNIFSSEIAYFLDLVFEWVCDETNLKKRQAMLLTPFFGFCMDNLLHSEELCIDHPLEVILQNLLSLAKKKAWPRFWQALLFCGRLYENAWFFEQKEAWISEMNQLFSEIFGKNISMMSASDVSRQIKLCRSEAFASDQNPFQAQKEKGFVKILTLHVSKGLQFPVVFVMPAYKKPKAMFFREFHAGTQRIFDFLDQEESQKQAKKENEDEEKRLYYVALTRAMLRVYFPFRNPEGKKHTDWLTGCMFQSLEKKDSLFVIRDLEEMKISDDFYFAAHPLAETKKLYDCIPIQKPLSFADRLHKTSSFSAFSRLFEREEEEGFHSFEELFIDREDDSSFLKELEILPPGAKTGTFLHELMEKLDFSVFEQDSEIRDSQSQRILRSTILAHGFSDEIFDFVKEMMQSVIHYRFREGLCDFSLQELSLQNRLNEVDFFFPFEIQHLFSSRITRLQGSIDLIFRHKNQFWIIDWKSNYLTPSQTLEDVIRHHHYDLQYLIYSLAFLRWLKFHQLYQEGCFGGVFYCFLRRMQQNHLNSVFFVKGEEMDTEEKCLEQIAQILERSQK